MKKFLLILLLAFVFLSCKKNEPNDSIIPPPDDSTAFAVPKTEDIVMYEVNLQALSATGDFQGVIDLGPYKYLVLIK